MASLNLIRTIGQLDTKFILKLFKMRRDVRKELVIFRMKTENTDKDSKLCGGPSSQFKINS